MPDALPEVELLNKGFVPSNISIDQNALMMAIKAHYIKAMKSAEQKLISIMKKEIKKTTYGKSPGKPKWRKELSSLLQETYSDIADNYIEYGVGIPDSVAENIIVKAMLVGYGSGFMAYGGAFGQQSSGSITAGPPGRSVWDNDLAGKHPSGAKGEYEIPQFNQEGNHFVYNSMMLMKKHFDDVLADASSTLSNSVFLDCVNVETGART